MAALGMEIVPFAKHSSGVKLHDFLEPSSCKSPIHLEEPLKDALLEDTRVQTAVEAGGTGQASPPLVHGACSRGISSRMLMEN